MADEYAYSIPGVAKPLGFRCERCSTVVGEPDVGTRNTAVVPMTRSVYGLRSNAAKAAQESHDDFRSDPAAQEGPTRPDPSRLLLTVEEAARRLSVGRTLMYTLVMRHEIASIKVGRTRRIPVAALHAFVARELGTMETPGGPSERGEQDAPEHVGGHAGGNV